MKRMILLALFTSWAAACGSINSVSDHTNGQPDKVIGDPCGADTQCLQRCLISSSFPDGFCTVNCVSDAQCPGDSVCVDRGGGVCLFVCPPFNCGFLGGSYRCDNQDHVGGGQVNVCIGP